MPFFVEASVSQEENRNSYLQKDTCFDKLSLVLSRRYDKYPNIHENPLGFFVVLAI
jgi:hypothetical protein